MVISSNFTWKYYLFPFPKYVKANHGVKFRYSTENIQNSDGKRQKNEST